MYTRVHSLSALSVLRTWPYDSDVAPFPQLVPEVASRVHTPLESLAWHRVVVFCCISIRAGTFG